MTASSARQRPLLLASVKPIGFGTGVPAGRDRHPDRRRRHASPTVGPSLAGARRRATDRRRTGAFSRRAGSICTPMSGTAAPTSRSARQLCGVERGVTTIVDAGSAGEANFHGFREFIIEPARERIKAFLNIGSIGLVACNRVSELIDIRSIDIDRTLAVRRGEPRRHRRHQGARQRTSSSAPGA